MPVWHVSIAVRDDSGGIAQAQSVSGFMLRQIRNFALELLKEVGEGPAKFEMGKTAFHLRRKVTPAELTGLPANWCAAPAIDEGGETKLLEWIAPK